MQIGDKIIVNSQLIRQRSYKQIEGGSLTECLKYWNEYFFEKDEKVSIIGVRYLSDGIVHNNNEESFFEPTKRFKALLVVKNLHTKPFYVKFKEV